MTRRDREIRKTGKTGKDREGQGKTGKTRKDWEDRERLGETGKDRERL